MRRRSERDRRRAAGPRSGRRLDGVTDPELDEPVTDLNFVHRVDVDAEESRPHRIPAADLLVRGEFLVPDGRRHAPRGRARCPGSRASTVRLGEHMYADKINAGLAEGRSFQDTFGAEADGDLDDLRRTFLIKAFQRRQAALLEPSRRRQGATPMDRGAMTMANSSGWSSTRRARKLVAALPRAARRRRPGAARGPRLRRRRRRAAEGRRRCQSICAICAASASMPSSTAPSASGLLAVRFDTRNALRPEPSQRRLAAGA